MAFLRSVDTYIWNDPFVSNLKPEFKLVWIYLLTNRFTNLAGVYEITISQIAFDLSLTEAFIGEALHYFTTERKAVYTTDNWLIMVNHFKHHRFNPAMMKNVTATVNALPPVVRAIWERVQNREPFGDLTEPYIFTQTGRKALKANPKSTPAIPPVTPGIEPVAPPVLTVDDLFSQTGHNILKHKQQSTPARQIEIEDEYKDEYKNKDNVVNVGKKIKAGIIERAADFREALKPFHTLYPAQMLEAFYLYWAEPDRAARLMRFEKEKTWSMSGRLQRWNMNNKSYTRQPPARRNNDKYL